jgi:diguanylate cyclase (GGDEF)-like protein
MTRGADSIRPDAVTADVVLRLLGGLEPDTVGQAFAAICGELLGPCRTRLFIYPSSSPDDYDRVELFGGDHETRTFRAPLLGPDGLSGAAVAPIEEEPAGTTVGWRALLPITHEETPLGVAQISFAAPVEPGGVAALRELVRVLGVAFYNSQTFEKTKRLTFTDDLTALYNARFMALYLDRELKRCRRTRASLSLLFMDLDGFKAINDTHGHLAGSRTLVEVGEVLEKTVRDADVLIRYGGDEFVILFPETPLSGGLVIAERIRQVIDSTKFLETHRLEARVSASIGIAAYPESADDVRGLISCADQAMYEAKALGKNRVVTAKPFRPSESS